MAVVPKVIFTEADLRDAVDRLADKPMLSFDVETTIALTTKQNSVLWVGLYAPGETLLLPIGHPRGELITPEKSVDVPDMSTVRPYKNNPSKFTKPKMVKQVQPAVFGPTPAQVRADIAFEILEPVFFGNKVLVGHNVKFDHASVSKYYGRAFDRHSETGDLLLRDTMLYAHVLDERLREYSLKYLTARWAFGRNGSVKAEVESPHGAWTYYENFGRIVEDTGIWEVARYLNKDLYFTWHLFQRFQNAARMQNLEVPALFEVETSRAVETMETNGVCVDLTIVDEIKSHLETSIRQVEVDAWRITGTQFELSKNAEKIRVLYDPKESGGQGLKPFNFTEKGVPRVDTKTLQVYADQGNELAIKFMEWSKLSKLLTAFLNPLPDQITDHGRVHTSLHQQRTETGRFSSSGPNLQQAPRPKKGAPPRSQLREIFVASPGYGLVVADYDQVELRIIAYLANDPEMIHLFANNIDIHAEAVSTMLDISTEDVTPEQRTVIGKGVNFSIGYGASAPRVAQIAGVSIKEAETFVERYYARFSKLAGWKSQILAQARASGDRSNPHAFPPYVDIPPFGRRRRIVDLYSENQGLRRKAERQAVNAVVQGMGAYIMKLALVDINRTLPQVLPDARLLLTVHDETLSEAPLDQVPVLQEVIETCMQRVTNPWTGAPIIGQVPLLASAATGHSWLEAK